MVLKGGKIYIMRNILNKNRKEKAILKMNKKGQVSGLSASILALVVAGMFLVLGMVILQEFRDSPILFTGAAGCNATDVTLCGEAFDAANQTLVGVGTFGDFWTIIVLAIVATVIIGLLVVGFGGRQR